MDVESTRPPDAAPALRRELGVAGATMLGLGSIIGTGVFVSIGVAAGVAGPSVVLAVALAAFVALCNALSSAQLAASYPVSGGTYEYGHIVLRPALGFTAGWMFLCAKSASAATAALGFAGYLLHALGWSDTVPATPVAIATVVALTAIVLGGIRRSSVVNIAIVSLALAALAAFVVGGVPSLLESGQGNLRDFFTAPSGDRGALAGFLEATALMFVAYTGYGRVATLGEEVREPARTIPRAIVCTLAVSALVYVAVAVVAVGAAGAPALGEATTSQAAPLEVVAREFRVPGVHWAVALGATVAMLGVLLNLILGLSRVLLAMGRRGDMPSAVARLNRRQDTPHVAVVVVGVVIVALASIGSVETTWSFSAFTVLMYYALTNLSALRLERERRLYSPAYAWCGLAACLFLAFWVEWRVWLSGLALVAFGLVWHAAARTVSKRARSVSRDREGNPNGEAP